MSSERAELELIRRAAAGDVLALEHFLLKHRGVILRYLDRRFPQDLRRHIDPQDVLQDVYFEVFRTMNTFEAAEPGMAVRWLLRIARNRLIDLWRRHNAEKRGSGDILDEEGLEGEADGRIVRMLQNLAVYERTPSQSALAHEMVAMLERCLRRIPPECQHALRHRYMEGMEVPEIATIMNRSRNAVMMLCSRGLAALRSEMEAASRGF